MLDTLIIRKSAIMWTYIISFLAGFGFTFSFLRRNKSSGEDHTEPLVPSAGRVEPEPVDLLTKALLAFALTRVCPDEVPDLDASVDFEEACFNYFNDADRFASVQRFLEENLISRTDAVAFFSEFVDMINEVDEDDEEQVEEKESSTDGNGVPVPTSSSMESEKDEPSLSNNLATTPTDESE